MKNLFSNIVSLFFILISYSLNAQFECEVIFAKNEGQIPDALEYIPDSNTPIKYIRVNIHFMLRSQGDPDYPGNFTKTGDGFGNTDYTGYDYAEDLINTANVRLSSNVQMRMPPGNNTQVLERKYRYVLNGVFFHEDNNYYYYYQPNPNNVYGQNMGECINIFLDNTNGGSRGGSATMTGNRWVKLKGTWERYFDYIQDPNIGTGIWAFAGTLNHEIGHNLSLFHTMISPSGNRCIDNKEDYCSDTPTRIEIINEYGFDPCCNKFGMNDDTCTNNLMDYTGEDAVTPQQLGRIHWTIENEIYRYRSCYYTTQTQNVQSFSENASYIAKKVVISTGANVTVDNNNALYINCEELEINGEFEIAKGSILIVNTIPDCN